MTLSSMYSLLWVKYNNELHKNANIGERKIDIFKNVLKQNKKHWCKASKIMRDEFYYLSEKDLDKKSWYLKTHHLAWLVPYYNHRLVKNTAAVLMFNLGHNHLLHWGQTSVKTYINNVFAFSKCHNRRNCSEENIFICYSCHLDYLM